MNYVNCINCVFPYGIKGRVLIMLGHLINGTARGRLSDSGRQSIKGFFVPVDLIVASRKSLRICFIRERDPEGIPVGILFV